MVDRDAIIAKVLKILARAEKGAGTTQAEMDEATKAAKRILDQYNLTMDDARAGAGSPGPEYVSEQATRAEWGLPPECEFVVQVVNGHFFVIGVHGTSRSGGKLYHSIRFFGDRTNVETAKFVYNFLCATYKRLWVSAQIEHSWAVNERRTYFQGLSIGLSDKLTEERKAAAKEHSASTGRDIVLVGNQLQRIMQDVHDAFTKLHGQLGYASSQPTVGSHAALSRGMQDGRSINIAKPLPGPSKSTPRSLPRKP